MEYIGKHLRRRVFYLNLPLESISLLEQLNNWICFAIASKPYPKDKAESFMRSALRHGMLEFKAQGSYGEDLHLLCDLTMVNLEIAGGLPEIDVATTGDDDTDLANAFWECFYATVLPERTDYDHLTIVCVSFDGVDYRSDLKELIGRFEARWIPED